MSLVKVFVLLTLVAIVSSRLSYYYADQANNYHPPYDKFTNAFNLNGSVNAATCAPFTCPAGFSRITNPNFSSNIVGACPLPAWVQGNTALLNFNGCCQRYSACLQTCGINKQFCDGQWYGCAYAACDPERNLRPGDRVYCRALASCYASYLTRPASCNAYNNYQNSACICSNSSTANSASQSPIITPAVGKRQNASPSTATQLPSASPTAASASNGVRTSSSPSAVLFASPLPSVDIYGSRFGNYFVRPIPNWELFQNRCPPNFENYVAVFTDQEQDDIGYYGRNQGSSSSLGSWLKF